MARPGQREAREVIDLLDVADRTVGACLARVTTTARLTREQWRALMLLSQGVGDDGLGAPGHTMGEIATRAVVPAPTATRIVDKLVTDGLAYRQSDPWDRRRVLVHLSPEGHAMVRRAATELDATFGSLLAGVPERGLVELWDLLDGLVERAALDDRTSAT